MLSETARTEVEQDGPATRDVTRLAVVAAVVAHDLANVLAAIANHAACASRELAGAGTPADPAAAARLRADLDQIRRGADRGTALVRQVLAHARGVPAVEPTDVATVLDALASGLRRGLPAGVALRTTVAPDCPPVHLDALDLERLVTNLCVNARHAVGRAGSIEVSARAVVVAGRDHPSGLAPGRYVCLEVADDGAGMAPDVLARATEPFFTTRPDGGGTGLGLASVDAVLSAAGGALDLRSAPGAGTACTAWIPAVTATADRS